ncbi:MAG: amino acid ABC transporter permease [Alphaproteobacteria bacterium]|nr:amino acid ABC transporter permease [Alphaproteobacteria bacterium]
MQLILDNLGLFAAGLGWTFRLAVVTLAISTVISAIIGTMSATRSRVARAIALVYVEFFRDIPLLVNVLFVFFGAPLVGIPLEPFGAATISFSLWGGANGAEIVRGGFNAVPRHQRESAVALGLKSWEIHCFVLAPQALLPMLPPFAGLFTLLVQATSLASLVGVPELFRIGQIVIERTTMMSGYSPAFVIYGGLLIVYYVICSVLTAGTHWLERRIASRTQRPASARAALPVVRPQESV